MGYNAWFSCINGCSGEYSLLEVIYRCPTCGDLLEVQHDVDALRTRSAAAWMHLLDRKSTRLNSSHGSKSYAVFCLKKKKKRAMEKETGKKKIMKVERLRRPEKG